jgi:serralysin
MCMMCQTVSRFASEEIDAPMPSGSVSVAPPQFDQMRPPYDMREQEPGDAYGAGRTALISQVFDAADGRYEFSGNQDIDATLIGSRWTLSNLTFSFPTSGTFYADEGYPAGTEPAEHVAFNAMQQDAVRYALSLVQSYTNLTFTEVAESATTHAELRFSQTSYDDVPSAYANFPSSSEQAGDVWFGMTGQPFYDTPAMGNWGMATILHEIGHALGLKHGHQDYTAVDLAGDGYLDPPGGGGPRYGSAELPANHDGQDWSLMTYRSDPGAPVAFQGEGFNQPQTYMQNDIAALQYLYGANFDTNSGATVYSWNPTTGEMSIDGVGQAAPTSNKISMTLWDGNGVDTYDLSNYATDLSIDLAPGAFSTFSTAQLVNHRAYSGGVAPAVGNVANALLYNNDTRSLIENATGGSGNDSIVGNQANNTLRGNDGGDTLVGSFGSDKLYGGSAADTLYGDGIPGIPPGVELGDGVVVKPAGAGNISLATAIDVTKEFSLASNTNIIDSTATPHVTISGTGDGNRDYYKLTVNAGTTLTFDIDNTSGVDSFLFLYDPTSTPVAFDDDSQVTEGAGGSTSSFDSYLTYQVKTAGTYYIEVGAYVSSTSNGPIGSGALYDLQISAGGTPGSGGGTGNDTLDGGTGDDSMAGGAGSDVYFVDSAADVVTETAGNGTADRVAARASYALAAGVSIELLTTTSSAGTTAIDLSGNALKQTTTGNAGANTLKDGGGVADALNGLGGDDIYLVYAAGTTVAEAAGQGSDRVAAAVDFALGAGVHIEVLTTTSSGGTAAIDLTGNALQQDITGNAGDNILHDGGAGAADTLKGLGGNDTYRVYNAGDVVVETAAQGVYDVVMAAVDYVLTAGAHVERLATNGTAGTSGIDLTGNEIGQEVVGNSGANKLDGKGGDDTMKGLAGKDTLTGGTGKDLFVFSTALNASTNVDTVTDFNVPNDTIGLDDAIFAALSLGTLAASAFWASTTGLAHDASDRILYETDTGALFYDADGTGAGARIQFAVLTGLPALANADFTVI